MAGAGMQEVMFDADAGWTPPETVSDDGWTSERVPSGTEVALNSIPAIVHAQIKTARSMLDMGRRLPDLVKAGQSQSTASIPRTRFNDPVGQKRAWGYTTVSLSDMKAVKNAHGVKLNDVYVAMVSGALRSYLDDRGELPDDSLVASIPVNARPDDSAASGNMISGMAASMASNIADPVERLMAIHANTTASKEFQQAMGAEMLMNLADTPPPAMMALAARFYARTQLVKRLPPMFNVVVSNVPGPREPLYNQGAPIQAFQSMGIVYDGAGLFIGAMSYMDQMDIGVLGGADALDAPFELADAISAELDTLVATIAKPKPTPRKRTAANKRTAQRTPTRKS
jgi:diacylglycerol O-acyltransferase